MPDSIDILHKSHYYIVYKDGDIKRMLYETVKKFPNRMKRGQKGK